ncbi:MAG: 50S ribosomal protein L27 [Candidatus Pacebacteria bacterium]|nr:50S ribosomal protein L27 [Candidatus Paceibacterota bacterium]
MAHRKAGGTSRNLKDSNPKYLGIKINDGQKTMVGSAIVRQRGTKFVAGKNVGLSKDHTLFAKKEGMVKMTDKKKITFTGKVVKRKLVEVL